MKYGDRGDGCIVANGKSWTAKRIYRGETWRKTFPTVEECKKQLRAWRKEIDGDKAVGPVKERVTVEELCDNLIADLKRRGAKSVPQFESHRKPIQEELGHIRAIDLTTARIKAYIAMRQGAGKADATINRETGTLRQAFRLALKEETLRHVPYFPMQKEDNTRQGFFEASDFEAVADYLPPTIEDVARFGYMTGWRKGEILGLTWDRVDLSASEIRLSTSKNGRPRVIGYDWSSELAKLIKRRWAARDYEPADSWPVLSPFVFHQAGRPIRDFLKRWRKGCNDARRPGRLFHDLRRTAARNLRRAGVDQTVAMQITGHVTDAMFRRYSITSTDDTRKALRQAERHVRKQKEATA